MRLVHVISGLEQGGAEAMLERLVHHVRDAHPEVAQQVVSLGSLGVVGQRLQEAGHEVTALHLRQRPLAACGALLRLFRQERGDTVVQTWLYHADLLAGLLARLSGCRRVVWNVRQSGLAVSDIGRATRAVARACAWLSRWVPDAIVCNADKARTVHVAFGYAGDRWQVIPNGFDTARLRPDPDARQALRASLGLGDDALVIGMLARLDPQKDHPNFLRMAAEVAAALPQARFLLVGRGMDGAEALQAQAQALGLGDRIHWLGQRSDIVAVLSAMDVFCLSSRSEGFPNVLAEAMACGVPAVSTDCGDAALILGDRRHIAPIEDAAALAARVLAVARLPTAQRLALGAAQRERVRREFDIAAIWQAYSRVYAHRQPSTDH